MSAALRFGIPAAVLLAVAVLLHRGAAPEQPRPARPAPKVRSSDPPGAVVPRTVPPAPEAASLPALLSKGALDEIPAGVLSGTFTVVEGPGGEPDPLLELSLTPSQRTVLDALVAERDAVLGGIRRQVEARPPSRPEADRLAATATAAQETCLASIRDTLLPGQRERFDALVESGRWGRSTLVIPIGPNRE
jgi:hypothetical protein